MVEVKNSILKKDTATALQKLEEGMTLVRDRMKLIKIADRSRFDWRTAEKYQRNITLPLDSRTRNDRGDALNRESSRGIV